MHTLMHNVLFTVTILLIFIMKVFLKNKCFGFFVFVFFLNIFKEKAKKQYNKKSLALVLNNNNNNNAFNATTVIVIVYSDFIINKQTKQQQ